MAPGDSSLLHQVPEDVLGKIHNTHTLQPVLALFIIKPYAIE